MPAAKVKSITLLESKLSPTQAQPMVYSNLKLNEELYKLIAAEADARNVPMNVVVVEKLANSFKRPELAFIPHKRMGRPRTRQTA